jgi:hypothetical protein
MPSTSPRAQTSGPQSQRKRPGDLTGVQGQKLAQERDERQEAEAAAALAAKQTERVEKLSTVVDYTQGGVRDNDVEVVDTPDEPHPAEMIIRVNYPIEKMTFGREVISPPVFGDHGEVIKPAVLGGMLTYDFEEGQQYRVPWELGLHLKRLGYVYDF